MKLIFAAAAVLCAFTSVLNAQTKPEPRVIEVSGSAERLITPDEFAFKLTVIERMDKKEKVTIEQQEASLRTELQKIGIDPSKDLSVYDISSAYNPRKRVRDVMGTKDYRLKVRDVNKIAPLVTLVDSINLGRLELIDTEHSEITRLRRETKMDAIKAAKEKAAYLLGAIGQRIGNATFIKEIEEETPRYVSSGVLSNNISNYSSNSNRQAAADSDDALSFSQIRLRYVIQAKFEIE